MRQKSETRATPEQIVKDIRRATRKHHSAEEKTVMLGTGTTLPCDLLLGVPKDRVTDVVVDAGLTGNG